MRQYYMLVHIKHSGDLQTKVTCNGIKGAALNSKIKTLNGLNKCAEFLLLVVRP